MRPPGEDHQSGGEQELAQVIPLRCRAHDQDQAAEISPITPRGQAPTAVFDPPADPEPPGEYSVWEQPIAELIRRGEPEPRRKRRPRTTGHSTRPGLLAAGVLAVLSGVLVLAFSGWLAGPWSHPARVPASAHASVSATRATTDPSRRPHAQKRSPAEREFQRSRSGARHTHATSPAGSSASGSALASTTEALGHPTGSQGSGRTATGGSGEAAAPSQTEARAAAVSAQEAAAREFGFEP